jgi:uncharacterized protein YndB with AHSA1/START domain
MEPITVFVRVPCPPAMAWRAFTDPASVMAWNFASPDWCCPSARNDLRVGGTYCYRMESRDGSMGFDFEGQYLEIVPNQRLRFDMGPEREVLVEFVDLGTATEVRQTFTPEQTHTREQQREGWQAIMDNYRRHVESL